MDNKYDYEQVEAELKVLQNHIEYVRENIGFRDIDGLMLLLASQCKYIVELYGKEK